MPIEKQIWTEIVREEPIQGSDFLAEAANMSEFVENNTINLADAGVEPNVMVDNTTYPLGVVKREDVPIALPLHTLDTENTVIRNIEEMESAYNKMESVTRGHKNALQRRRRKLAAYNWCPQKNSAYTPVLVATGEADSTGRKRLTFDDLDELEAKFEALEIDLSRLVFVLNPKHKADLKAENRKLYKELMADGRIGNFKVYTFPHLPYFDKTSGEKQVFGAAPGANSSMASLAFVSNEVMIATGDTEPFVTYKDPKERGDILGYQQRFTALPLRNKYIGAIYS